MPRETADEKCARMTAVERTLWEKGAWVCGIDEVGRGPLAGPVVTACVSVPQDRLVLGVDDSKKVAEKKREGLCEAIMACATYCRVARIEPEEIDATNILLATKRAMESAAAGALGAYFLVDAVTGLRLPGDMRAIVHGDQISYMIAAASIVAKVTRDRYMIRMDDVYPQYGFARNKGYGTAEHIQALRRYGPCPIHRRSFITHFTAVDP